MGKITSKDAKFVDMSMKDAEVKIDNVSGKDTPTLRNVKSTNTFKQHTEPKHLSIDVLESNANDKLHFSVGVNESKSVSTLVVEKQTMSSESKSTNTQCTNIKDVKERHKIKFYSILIQTSYKLGN